MKKWLFAFLLITSLFLGLPNQAAAETIGANTVYVAGNPDLYPFEYYDTQLGCYQGILPSLYRQISQTTGLEFVYIHPGTVNQQSRLAKNCQVELVSAHVRGDIEAGAREMTLMQLDGGIEICLAFTSITPEWMETSIRSAWEELSDRQLLELAVAVPEPHPEVDIYLWAGIIGTVLLLTVIVLASVLLHRRSVEKKKNQLRFVDPLTGIGNKLYFENTYRFAVTPVNHALYYLCYLSLDLQRAQEYLGPLKAEEIQRYAADVLSQAAADEDFTARAEDGIFLLGLQAPSEEAAGDRISELLNRLNQYEGTFLEEHRILFRSGIFRIDTANLPVETAIFNARQGYHAAVQTQYPYIFVDQNLLSREASKLELQRKLSSALETHEFLLFMQMIVDRDGRIIGAEALTRWQNREEGLLSPGIFIEPLKDAGLIHKLDFCILEEACSQLEQWSRTGKGHLWISCNFTRLTVSRSDFMDQFRNVLGRYRFAPDRLIIELTEDSLMDNTAAAYRNILECKKMGCQIALDDLGSGYSSLRDLCDYPIDMIKIDRDILLKSSTPRGNALLHGLTKLGHDLGMKVLCEGVETEQEKHRVYQADCDYIQGFYFSRVLPREEANLFYTRMQET